MTEKTVDPRDAGQPLPPSLRVRMEAFWGEDLSDVRIHIRPEVTALGAAALTVGTDIWFAPGMYDPTRPEGLRRLGHELAHVCQQRRGRVRPPPGREGRVVRVQEPTLEAEADRLGAQAAAFVLRGLDAPEAPVVARTGPRQTPHGPRLVQCMPMGVELECSNLDLKAEGKHEIVPKKGVVITTDEKTFKAVFEATSSGAHVVEFVTQPPADSKEGLLGAVGNMAALAGKWDAETKQWFSNQSVSLKTENGNWVIRKRGPILGMLQITIGVPLHCVPAMYQKFDNCGDNHLHRRSLTLWNSVRTSAQTGGMGPDGQGLSLLRDETWGLLMVVIDYLNRAASPHGKPYVKAQFDTLARTNFVTLFGTLSAAEQTRLSELVDGRRVMRDVWVDWLLRLVLVKERETASQRRARKMLPWAQGFCSRVLPTFYEWLKALPHRDLLNAKRSDHFQGLGQLQDKLDTVTIRGQQEPAPIFELRAPLGTGIPYEEWVARIGKFWDLYQQCLVSPALPLRPSPQAVTAAMRDLAAHQAAARRPPIPPRVRPRVEDEATRRARMANEAADAALQARLEEERARNPHWVEDERRRHEAKYGPPPTPGTGSSSTRTPTPAPAKKTRIE